jgi:hypothetical protein
MSNPQQPDFPVIPNVEELLRRQLQYRADVIVYYRNVLAEFFNRKPSPIEVLTLGAWLIASLLNWQPELADALDTELLAATNIHRSLLNDILAKNPAAASTDGPIYILPEPNTAAPVTRPDATVMIMGPSNLTSDGPVTVH